MAELPELTEEQKIALAKKAERKAKLESETQLLDRLGTTLVDVLLVIVSICVVVVVVLIVVLFVYYSTGRGRRRWVKSMRMRLTTSMITTTPAMFLFPQLHMQMALEKVRELERPLVTRDTILISSTREFKHIINLMALRSTCVLFILFLLPSNATCKIEV